MGKRSKKAIENDFKNIGWSVQRVAKQYKYLNPEWTEDQCIQRARAVVKELNRMNRLDVYRDQQYYRFVTSVDDVENNFNNVDANFSYEDIFYNMNIDDLL